VIAIAEESPLGADLALLHARHRERMHEDTPPGSIHMMEADALAVPGIRFFVLREAGVPRAMGAYKRLSGSVGEIKSMHVLAEARGRGFARAMLDHLMAVARVEGLTRLSLETGAQESFAESRRLYLAAGFEPCGPFEGYGPDPNSAFMSRAL
jgi:putative acetyltransferase